jgi:RNA polymerase sigma factor (sigma-70 family)
MRLLDKYDSLKNKEQIVPWIFVTARNCCFNMLRDNKKFINAACCDEIGISDRIDEKINARQLIRLLFENFDRNVRDAVLYTYVEQLEQKDIQKITGQSPATIRRNLKKFKDYLPSIKKRLGLV